MLVGVSRLPALTKSVFGAQWPGACSTQVAQHVQAGLLDGLGRFERRCEGVDN